MSKSIKAFFVGLLLTASACVCQEASAQRVALKTNTIDWVAMSPNLAFEARLSRRMSVQLSLAGNPFPFHPFDIKLSNFRVEPELRYWFNRPMARHFMALLLTAATYSLGFKDRHINGDAVAAGFSYGYALVLSRHWNMEAEVGVGVAHVKAFDYRGEECPKEKNLSKIMPVPVRLGLSFAYIFK